MINKLKNMFDYRKRWKHQKNRNKRLVKKIKNYWNKLKEDLKRYDLEYLHQTGEHQFAYSIESILDKMQELEKGSEE